MHVYFEIQVKFNKFFSSYAYLKNNLSKTKLSNLT